jgi:phosphatidate cytidylyltransferase
LTRILSALVILPIVIGSIWYSPWTTLVVGIVAATLAFVEYAALAEKLGAQLPRLVSGVATVATAVAFDWPGGPLDAALLTGLVAIGAMAVAAAPPSPSMLTNVAAAGFPVLYLGLPIGAIVSIRRQEGAGVLLLLVAIIVISDTAQYYTGRLIGRRPLAPAISPKKTREGALGGLLGGAAAAWWLGGWWLPDVSPGARALLGLTVAAAGIVGDLFESHLKRSAGVKDTSTLIPGHGGVLDRIDSWLFAGPIYYVFLRYVL